MKPYHRRCFSASASKIKDVLIVKKASRFDRLAGLSRVHDAAINEKSARKAGVMMTAKLRNIRDNHRDQLEDAKKEHNKIVEELEKKCRFGQAKKSPNLLPQASRHFLLQFFAFLVFVQFVLYVLALSPYVNSFCLLVFQLVCC